MRIAILTHSTNPRGGVAHALAVAESFSRLGHEAVVHAPAGPGRSFYRAAGCETRIVAATPATGSLVHVVKTRIADYVRHFEASDLRAFDVFHCGDGISANALATLRRRGLIPGFSYTVHHVERFADEEVDALQQGALRAANRHLTVSRLWQEKLAAEYVLSATVVGNGVDRAVYRPEPDGREEALHRRLGLGSGPVFLSVGGVEHRKNSVAILRAFAGIVENYPDARLVLAGGASLLDHAAYRAEFDAALNEFGPERSRVVLTGPVDQEDMPALYRIADALVFPSLVEGFGLAAVEAIACGTPAIVSAIRPFIDHFADGDVLWCDPHRPASIGDAMARALQPSTRARLADRAENALAPHGWDSVARAHLPVFESLREAAYA